jgi:hypothetical protein
VYGTTLNPRNIHLKQKNEKQNKYDTIRTVPKSNWKFLKTGKSTHIHDSSHSSIQWSQTSILSEIIWLSESSSHHDFLITNKKNIDF